ncbi:MAG: twitching motility protein PilT [Lachnospiraceae bacterium]
MVQLIAGRKGKGKTKHLLDKVNEEVKNINGNIVYLDKSTKHMYELNNKVRLIDVSDYLVEDTDEFLGFVSGIISQDHDLQQMYFDSFLKIAHLENGGDILPAIDKLEKISGKFGVDFILSVSVDENELPEAVKSKIIVSL